MNDRTEEILEEIIQSLDSCEEWFPLHQNFILKLILKREDRMTRCMKEYCRMNIFSRYNFLNREDSICFAECLKLSLNDCKCQADDLFLRLCYRFVFNYPPEDDFDFWIYDSTALAINSRIPEDEVQEALRSTFNNR